MQTRQRKNTVTKDELVLKVAELSNQPLDIAREVIQQTFVAITTFLVQGRRLELRRFGVFHVRTRRTRIGRNPNQHPNQPGTNIPIPEAKVPGFKPSIIMKKLVKDSAYLKK